MKKQIKYALLVLLVLGGGAAAFVMATAPMTVSTLTLIPQQARHYFTEQGFVRHDPTSDIFATVGGEILSLHVAEGDTLHVGQTIATVDVNHLHNEIAQLQVSNQSLEAQIRNLQVQNQQQLLTHQTNRNALLGEYDVIVAQQLSVQTAQVTTQETLTQQLALQHLLIDQSEQQIQQLESDFLTLQVLYNAGAVPRTRLTDIETALNTARSTHNSHVQQLEVIKAGAVAPDDQHFAGMLTAIQAQIAGIDATLQTNTTQPMQEHFQALITANNLRVAELEQRLLDGAITSPVAGIIATLHIDNTNIINPALPIATVTTDNDYLVEVLVSTLDIDAIETGDTVELVLRRQGGDQVYTGQVVSIDTQAREHLSTLGIAERRVQVLIAPEPAARTRLHSGFDVDVRFISFDLPDQLLVPRTAVFDIDGTDHVFVNREGVAVLTPVQVLRELRAYYVIETGLHPGDIVIRDANQTGLSEGVSVTNG